jgi:hypothetical protein
MVLKVVTKFFFPNIVTNVQELGMYVIHFIGQQYFFTPKASVRICYYWESMDGRAGIWGLWYLERTLLMASQA